MESPKGSSDNLPLGIMTYWDLNRRSVYTYIYSVFVFFEQMIKEEIYKIHGECDSNCVFDYISMNDKNRRHKRNPRLGVTHLKYNISLLNFRELSDFLRKQSHRKDQWKSKIPESVLDSIVHVRNNIAHPVSLILEGGTTKLQHELSKLREICVAGKEVVMQYDDNTKNTIYSTALNKIKDDDLCP